MAYYVVSEVIEGQKEPKQHLVNAKTGAGAIKAIAEPRFTATVASPQDLITLTEKGIKCIDAGGNGQ